MPDGLGFGLPTMSNGFGGGGPGANALALAEQFKKLNAATKDRMVNPFQAQQAPLDQSAFNDALARARGVGDQQASLAQQLAAQANGQGPSLAQMQLQQATNQNQAMAAGQMASQRGLNPALAARLIGQNRAAIQQGAAGQSGMLALNEQMQARQQLAQALAAQQQGAFGMGQLGNQNNALNLQNWQAMQGLNAGVAQGNQQTQLGLYGIDSGVAAGQKARDDQFGHQLLGGALSGAGAVLGTLAGGPVGGAVGAKLGGAAAGAVTGNEPAIQSPVEYATGGLVPGDSPRNDIVPAQLSPGEIVLPRSVAQSEDAPEMAAKFVAAIKKSKQKPTGYGEVLAKNRELEGRLARVEAFFCGGQVK